MTTIYNKNAISQDVLNELIDIYDASIDYDTATMKKASGMPAIKVLENVKSIDTDRIRVCHFYKHKAPYYPHSDFHHVEKDNIVIPLKVFNGKNPFLIVFDQSWSGDGITWTNKEKIKFKFNEGISGRPYDHDIDNKTDQPIPNYLYNRYLNWQPRDFWFGLSGTPYEFIPGNFIQFDSKVLHATSTMHCEEKLGLTIRYKI